MNDARVGSCLFALSPLVVVNVPSAITLLAGFHTSSWGALGLGVAAGVVLGAIWLAIARRAFPRPDAMSYALHHAAPAAFLLVLALLLPSYVAFTLSPSLRELRGQWPIVDIAAAGPTDADLLELRGGVAKRELVGRYTYEVKNHDVHVLVAPLVEPRWSPKDPIRVWLVCVETYDADEKCGGAFAIERHLGRPETNDLERFQLAIRDAEKKHAVSAADRVLLLRASADSRFDSWGDVAGLGMFLVVGNLVLLGMTARFGRRRAP